MTDETTAHDCPTCGRDLPADAPQGLCPYCLLMPAETLSAAAHFTPPHPADLRQHFDGIGVGELLGRGGMGAATLAAAATYALWRLPRPRGDGRVGMPAG